MDDSDKQEACRSFLLPEGLPMTRTAVPPKKMIDKSKAPKWVLAAAKVAIKQKKLPKSPPLFSSMQALYHVAETFTGDGWLDHAGRIKWDGYELLTSEPYVERLSATAIEELEKFVGFIGGSYLICARSEHLPGKTVLIVISNSAHALESFRKSLRPEELIQIS
jgi:hypothetical protein